MHTMYIIILRYNHSLLLLVCLSAGLSPEHELPHCLLLVNVLGQLGSQPEEVQELWFSGSQFSEETPR